MGVEDRTRPDRATRTEERLEADLPAQAGDGPTADEERAADDAAEELASDGTSERVAEHYEEMVERGAHQQGEGRLP